MTRTKIWKKYRDLSKSPPFMRFMCGEHSPQGTQHHFNARLPERLKKHLPRHPKPTSGHRLQASCPIGKPPRNASASKVIKRQSVCNIGRGPSDETPNETSWKYRRAPRMCQIRHAPFDVVQLVATEATLWAWTVGNDKEAFVIICPLPTPSSTSWPEQSYEGTLSKSQHVGQTRVCTQEMLPPWHQMARGTLFRPANPNGTTTPDLISTS